MVVWLVVTTQDTGREPRVTITVPLPKLSPPSTMASPPGNATHHSRGKRGCKRGGEREGDGGRGEEVGDREPNGGEDLLLGVCVSAVECVCVCEEHNNNNGLKNESKSVRTQSNMHSGVWQASGSGVAVVARTHGRQCLQGGGVLHQGAIGQLRVYMVYAGRGVRCFIEGGAGLLARDDHKPVESAQCPGG
jgi:hypothetical protein